KTTSRFADVLTKERHSAECGHAFVSGDGTGRMITIDDIETARERIAPHIRRTPILEASHTLKPLPLKASVVLKLELLQVTGSFKARGAMNRLLGTAPDDIRAGI